MDADDGGVDHLHGRVMRASQRIHNLAPDARPPPPDEATVAGGVRTKDVRLVPPQRRDRSSQKMPFRTRRAFTRGMPRACSTASV
jgi:hypothetical protein